MKVNKITIIKTGYFRLIIEYKQTYKNVQNILLEMCGGDVVIFGNGLYFPNLTSHV